MLIGTWTCQAGSAQETETETETAQTLWAAHVQPLLQEHCQSCHGGAKQEAGLDLRTIESLLAGGENGPVVVAGNPQESRLWQVVQPEAENAMPPKGPGLNPEAREILSRWLERVDTQGVTAPAEWASAETVDPLADLELPAADLAATQVIDQLVAAAWAEHQTPPNPLASDAEFLRRVSLDLIGRIPTTDEVVVFLDSDEPQKREAVIDRLLDSEEHAVYFAELFDTMFMGRPRGRAVQGRRDQGWHEFLRTAFRENRPWNEVLRAMALARPEKPQDRGAAMFLFERNNNHQAIAEAVGKAMFGLQIECAQCHDHPLAAEIKQAHYWGMVAFFSRGENKMTPHGPRVAETAVGAYANFTNLSGESFPNRLTFLGVDPLEDPRPENAEEEADGDENYREPVAWNGSTEGLPRVPKYSRREAFANEVLAEHPWVARAMVNRLWAILMGRGIVHPVDKIDSVHPATHPELLAWLARDFESHDYDVRRMIRAIVLSEPYQLAAGRPTPATAPESFSYSLEKPLTAETLSRNLALVLYGPGKPIPGDVQVGLIREFPDVLAEEYVGKLQQSLYLSNNPEFNDLFDVDESPFLKELVGLEPDGAVIERMTQVIYQRAPTSQELAMASNFLAAYGQERRAEAVEQLLWVMVTNAEFQFNH